MARFGIGFFVSLMLALIGVAALNLFVDENGVYRADDAVETSYITTYVTRLRASSDGLVFIPQERRFKVELARQSTVDCYVTGSSHVLQIDHLTAPDLFPGCRQVVNLGVSGAGFEDIIAHAGVLAAKGQATRLMIGLGPWSLRRKTDVRWTEERATYDTGRSVLDLPRAAAEPVTVDTRWLGVINGDYAAYNTRALLRRIRDRATTAKAAPSPSATGRAVVEASAATDIDQVVLPNGRLVYARGRPGEGPVGSGPARDGQYKIEQTAIDASVLQELDMAVRTLQSRGIKVAFLLTPYNPTVMSCRNRYVCETMARVETALRALAASRAIPAFGSYDPRPMGITSDGFIDDMHLEARSLPAIKMIIQNPWADHPALR
jgi:hypothetical protein